MINMYNFSEIETIYEFTNGSYGLTCGVYVVIFKGKRQVFVRNGESIGAISHYLNEPASKCIGEIRDDVKQEFLGQLVLKAIKKKCCDCTNWSGRDCTLVAPDMGCPDER